MEETQGKRESSARENILPIWAEGWRRVLSHERSHTAGQSIGRMQRESRRKQKRIFLKKERKE